MGKPVAPRGQARERVVEAALHLFAEHGFAGTSLQMIADELGVTKAAVYHQFRAKEDIVAALIADTTASMSAVADAGEAAPPPRRAQVTIAGLIDLILAKRDLLKLSQDPDIERISAAQEELVATVARVDVLVYGPDPSTAQRITAAVLGGGLVHAATDPALRDVPEEQLRAELVRLADGLLRLAAK